MTKYAPANGEGKKPYIVEGLSWGKDVQRLVWGKDVAEAKYRAGLSGTGQYVRRVRRALIEEVEADK